MIKYFISILIYTAANLAFGQGDSTQNKSSKPELFKKYGLMLDYQFLTYQSVSLGFGFLKPFEHASRGEGLMIKNEFIFKNQANNFVYSPQITGFIYPGIYYLGVKLSYYTDFNDYTFVTAPEFGLGLAFLFVSYSRNIDWRKSETMPMNENNISLKILIPLNYW